MEMKIPIIAISVFVGIVVLAGVLMPVLDDATTTHDTYENSGFFYAKPLTATSTDVLSYKYTSPGTLTINGTDIDASAFDSSYSNITVAFSNKWFIRYAIDTGIIYLYDVDTETSGSTNYASPSKAIDFTMTCASGTATIVIGEDTYTETISGDGLIISPEKAEYVMKKSSTKAYVAGDSVVYGSGRTDRALGTSGSSFNAMFKASVDDGVTPIAFSPNTYTVTDSSVSSTEVTGLDLDLYQLTAYSISITDGVNSGTVTYNQIFVPTEVTVERAEHFTDNENAIFAAIPIMVIVALLIGVVALVFRGRNF